MTNNFELATYSRDDLFKNMEWLSDNNTNVRSVNSTNLTPAAKGGNS